MLGLWVLVCSALLLGRLNSGGISDPDHERVTARSLAEAKEALIAWAVSASSATRRPMTPGLLPFPDRNRDGNYDGKGDCVTYGLNASHLLGRLPWAGSARPCPPMGLQIDVRDAAGERLWYAVSRNVVTGGGGGPVNPDMGEPGTMANSWIVVRDADGDVITDPHTGMPLPVAAAIVAPGAALESQNRSGTAPTAENYLDRRIIGTTTYDNSDADGCADFLPGTCSGLPTGEEFITGPGEDADGRFNDRLVYISAHELMRAVQGRVLGEVVTALNEYRHANGAYPWLARFTDPRVASFKSNLSRDGLLPVHLPGEVFSTRIGGSWRFIDSTPTTVTRHSGDRMLVPPLADGMTGTIQIPSRSGRCAWSDSTRGDCTGSRSIAAQYRADLGKSVVRTVEYAFSIIDDTPLIVWPARDDVRRRTLTVNAYSLPRLPVGSWSIRITDQDGLGWGQRDIIIDADTGGEITLSGIRYDLSVVYDGIEDGRDELPEWFVENDWHHFIYVAYSQDAVAGGNADGDGDCATPASTCLTLNVDGRTARSDVRALVVSSGARWADQDRSIGDCNGDGIHDDFLCAYLEGENSDKSTPVAADTYARDRYSAWFNDQVRVAAPLPP